MADDLPPIEEELNRLLQEAYDRGYRDAQEEDRKQLREALEKINLGPIPPPSVDLSQHIQVLDLSDRTRNCLLRAQITTLDDLVDHSKEDLLAINNFGPKALGEVIERLEALGLHLHPVDRWRRKEP